MHASVLSVPVAAAICHDRPPEPQPLTAPAETGSRNSPSQNSQTKPQANRPAYQRTASQTEPTTNQIVIQPTSQLTEPPVEQTVSCLAHQQSQPASKKSPARPSRRPSRQKSAHRPKNHQPTREPSAGQRTTSRPSCPISGPCRR